MGLDQEGNIVRGLIDGEVSAWNRLYEIYFDQVWSAAARMMGHRQDAIADVVQETFVAAAQSAKTYDSARGSLWSWLGAILRREVANHYRRRYRENRLAPGGDMVEDLMVQISNWLESRTALPDENLLVAEVADAVRQTLVRLPSEYRLLLVARYRDEVTIDAMAEEHHTSVAALRSKLARARKAFREVFGKEPLGNATDTSVESPVPYEEMEVPK